MVGLLHTMMCAQCLVELWDRALNLTLCCFSSRRPVSARARSDGPDASQHVHALEDAQRQPQSQATVHGERMMAGLQACLSECVRMCTVALWVDG